MTSHEAYIVLNLLPGIGPIRVQRLLAQYGSPEQILRQSESALSKVAGIGPTFASTLSHWSREIDLPAELHKIEQAGVSVITLGDDDYPPRLRQIYDPPVCLYLRGNRRALLQEGMLAVVGSRRVSRYGTGMAERLTAAAVAAGLTIVSGLALGIDTVVHQTTVDNNGVTVAVLGGGLGAIYPQENVALARAICDKGAVISEQPMGMKPDRRTFPMRNRIISGLSVGTLVVEAGAKSGALITAQQALDQGRHVFAVPGRVDNPQSRGCHSLIKQGAKLVETLDDILEDLQFLPGFAGRAQPPSADEIGVSESIADGVTPVQSRILQLLTNDELPVDELQHALGLAMPELLANLLQLELKRLVVQLPGKRFMLHRRVHTHE